MRKLILIILPLLLSACINENSLHPNFPSHNLHANSAKAWVLTKSSNFDEYKLPEMNAYRRTFIFYSNLSFREQELIHLGSNEGLIGRYKIEQGKAGYFYLVLNYVDHPSIVYKIVEIKNDYLKIQDLAGDQTEWELKTLNPPEL